LLSDAHNIARIGGFLKKYFVKIWSRHPARLPANCGQTSNSPKSGGLI
jgi:hypothetical protein